MNARRTTASVSFAGVDVSAAINDYLLSISYTDNDEDDTDDLQIKLQDRDDTWMVDYLNSIIAAAGEGSPSDSVAKPMIYKVKSRKRLAVRSGPGEDYPVLGKLASKKKITVYEIKDDWARIRFSQRTAYVMEKFIKYVSQGEADTSTDGEAALSKGVKIEASFVRDNWTGEGESDTLDCGEFELDSISANGLPSTITIKGTSLPFNASIRQTKKSRAWEKYNLSGIASEMADNSGMSCLYESSNDPYYDRKEQVATSDIEFLSGLCHDAGLSLKTANNLLIIFDQAQYESAEPIMTIPHGASGGYTKYRLGTGESDVSYASCHVSYTDPSTGKTIEAMAYAEGYKADEDNQCLEVTAAVRSIAEAEELARKMLRLHNKFEYSGSFTFPGMPILAAGLTVELTGWGTYTGKYIISQARHQLSSSGYTTTIAIRRAYANDETMTTGERFKVIVAKTAVRSGPGKKFKKYGKLKKNAIVYVLGEENGWSAITYKEKSSYVFTKHLRFIGESGGSK